MSEPKNIEELNNKIQLLEIKIKHLTNELRLTREEYETSVRNYFNIYSNMEKRVEERTLNLKKLYKILKIKNQQLQIILDSSSGMIFYKDAKQRYIRVNKKFSKTLEVPIAEIIGKSYVELFPKNTSYLLEDDSEVIQKGEPILNRTEYIETSKGKRQILIDKIPYKDIDGKVIGIIGFALDVTDLKKEEKEKRDLEEKLVRSEKMEAIGLLAGGVAHDLNNVLTGIVSYPELLLMQLPEDSPLRESILTIQNSGQRAAAIVQDLLTLARRGVAISDVVNLNDIISDYLRSPEYEKLNRYHPNVKFEIDPEPNLLNILGSPIHLSKTLMNLVSNAAEALPDGGKVTISTRNQYVDLPIKGYDRVEEGEYVILSISDNGIGISAEDLEKIFELFYTKKVMGRSGTGLGMAVVWGTVKDHKGYIDVHSKVGEGTVFELYFPVTRKEAAGEKIHISIEKYMGNGEKILVVDDVPEQRKIASEFFTRLGYAVNVVSNGEEAVEYMKVYSADLLVLDMIMDPGIDGLETYRRILELHPGQKAIIVSGFSETERVKEAQRLGAGTYVKKPYILEKIGLAVRTELE